jgi:hypothetical protein
MTNKQQNRLTMMMAVAIICKDLAALFALLPNFPNLVIQLGNLIRRIQDLGEAQEKDYKGKADYKYQVADNLIAETMIIIRRVVAYATVTNKPELLQTVNYSKSELEKMTDQDVRAACQIVHDTTEEELPSLVDYKVTKVMLDAQQANIDLYTHEITSPREGIIQRKNATTELPKVFKEATGVLKVMDSLIETVRESNPDAYNNYMDARIVIDRGVGKKETVYVISGKIVDFETGKPLGGVSISVPGTTIVVVTAIDGLFHIEVTTMGEYQLEAEATGYKVQLIDVTVEGVTTEVEIEMEKPDEV